MSERIHHRCRCLDRNFTFSEWCDYAANQDRGVVFTHGDFGFNINDVCLTPHVPIDVKIKGDRFKIETAQSPNGRWSFGVSYSTGYTGRSYSVVFIDNKDEGYPTEKEAIFAGLKEVEKGTRRALEDIPDCEYDEAKDKYISTAAKASSLRQVLAKIESLKELYNPQQLSLFDDL